MALKTIWDTILDVSIIVTIVIIVLLAVVAAYKYLARCETFASYDSLGAGEGARPKAHKDRIFAPYVESWAAVDVAKSPAKNVVLAFLLSKKGQLAWDGSQPLGAMKKVAAAATAKGGRVILSFGGATGKELAADVTNVDELANKYAAAAREYSCTWLDFDIEGGTLGDKATNTHRNKAIAKVQKMLLPGTYVSFTLPVMPTGLDGSALGLLKDAQAQGVTVGCVNIMAMDYGDSFGGDMGKYAIDAAKATRAQLDKAGLSSAKVGITPMIGKNDNGPNPFSVANAKAVVDFANATPWVGLLAYWALSRDNGKKDSLNTSSMISQGEFDFARAFAKYDK